MNKSIAILAVKISLSAILAFIMACALQISTPFWAVVSAFIVSQADYHTLLKKSWMRVLGVIVGCSLSYVLMAFFVGYALLFSLVSFVIIMMASYLGDQSKFGYFWAYALLHIVVIGMVIVTEPSTTYTLAFDRASSVSLGVVATIIIQIALWPLAKSQQPATSKQLPKKLSVLHAINHAIAMLCAIWLWQFFQIPGGGINMCIAIITVMQLEMLDIYVKGGQRLIGCLVGVLLGLCLAALTDSLVLSMLALFCVGFICMTIYHGKMRHAYAALQAAVAFSITAFPSLAPATTLTPGIERAFGILFGVVVAMVISGLFMSLMKLFSAKADSRSLSSSH